MLVKRIGCCLLLFSVFSFSCEAMRHNYFYEDPRGIPMQNSSTSSPLPSNQSVVLNLDGEDDCDCGAEHSFNCFSRNIQRNYGVENNEENSSKCGGWSSWTFREKALFIFGGSALTGAFAAIGTSFAYATGAFDNPNPTTPHPGTTPKTSCNPDHVLINKENNYFSCYNNTLESAPYAAPGQQCLPGKLYFYETKPGYALSCKLDGQWGDWVQHNATAAFPRVSKPLSPTQPPELPRQNPTAGATPKASPHTPYPGITPFAPIGGCNPGETSLRPSDARHPGGKHTCDSSGEWTWEANPSIPVPVNQNAPCGELGSISGVTTDGHSKCMGSTRESSTGWSWIKHGDPVQQPEPTDSVSRCPEGIIHKLTGFYDECVNGEWERKQGTPPPVIQQNCLLDVRTQAPCHTPGQEHLQCWDKKCENGPWEEQPVKPFNVNCKYERKTVCSEVDRRGVPGDCWVNSCSGVEFTEIWEPNSQFMISMQYGDRKLPQDIKDLCERQIQYWTPHVLGVKGTNQPKRVVVKVNTAPKEKNTTGGIVSRSPSDGLVTEGVINISEQHFDSLKEGEVLCSHEMGHVLVTTHSPGSNPNYDQYIDENPRGASYSHNVSNTYFYAPRTMKFYGGPVPVNTGLWRGDHWAYNLKNQRTGESVSGLPINGGHSTDQAIGALNWCAMSDLGWDTVGCPVPDQGS